MKLESLKSRLNNQKNGQIKGKSTKIAPAFIKNKPNSPIVQIDVTNLIKMIYPIFTSLTKVKNKPNQTQFKPKTNPIAEKALINISSFMTSKYEKNGRYRAKKQTQTNPKTKPIQAYPRLSQSGGKWDSKMLVLDFSYIQGKLWVTEKINHWFFREKVYDSTDGFNRLLRALLRELRNSGKFRQRP